MSMDKETAMRIADGIYPGHFRNGGVIRARIANAILSAANGAALPNETKAVATASEICTECNGLGRVSVPVCCGEEAICCCRPDIKERSCPHCNGTGIDPTTTTTHTAGE